MKRVDERLTGGSSTRWQRLVRGAGTLAPGADALRFDISGAATGTYSNAQIDDYQGLPRKAFRWEPPLRFTVRARFSRPLDQVRGTAGFGFWNDPFLMTGLRLPALPRAAWFFHASPPSNMKLALDVPGYGWKAAVVDALRPGVLPWALLSPLLVPLMNAEGIYQRFWPRIERALHVDEASLNLDAARWHTYILEWGTRHARFSTAADGAPATTVLDAPAPRGPLGFVMWMDNQFLVATPWGRLRWGTLDVPGEQWMEVSAWTIEPEGSQHAGARWTPVPD
ncbi:MAG: hypothetical protein PVG11_04890 [Anaerolineae bacterium]|jgi:hypothetical protein